MLFRSERRFSSPLNEEHRKGVFLCAGCRLPLFSSGTKFESGTGWPSFWRPIPKAVQTSTDHFLGHSRVEVHCRRCGGHLRDVLDDGRSEEHTSELQSLMRISYAVLCLKTNKKQNNKA